MSDIEPCRVDLNADETKSWCSCGLSSKGPFCDGSHKGNSELRPVRFQCDEAKTVYLCMCKQTKNPPYCDGSHGNL